MKCAEYPCDVCGELADLDDDYLCPRCRRDQAVRCSACAEACLRRDLDNEGRCPTCVELGTSPTSNPPAPHSNKVLYLAVMPRNRKPKSVAPSSIGFYQSRAKAFYEARGMTAEQARAAIKDGSLLPTWQNGQPVTSYAVGERPLLGAALAAVEEGGAGVHGILRLGRQVYQAQWYFRSQPGSYGAPARKSWHATGLSGYTYSDAPIGWKETQKALRDGAEWEVGRVVEDDRGVSMGALAAIAAAGASLTAAQDATTRAQVHDLVGRRYRVANLVGPYRLTAADLDSLSRR